MRANGQPPRLLQAVDLIGSYLTELTGRNIGVKVPTQTGVVQEVTCLGNTDHVNSGWFTYDSTNGHPKKGYPLLNHAALPICLSGR